jgi:hypothetical protein
MEQATPLNDLSVKGLAEAVSTQVRVTNRYWLALVALSLFVTSPPAATGGKVQLPLGLGMVDEASFGFVTVMMVSALVVAFCSAHAQVLRVQVFINGILDSRRPGPSEAGCPNERDYYDALREPAVTRVAPLAQIARGKHQFFSEKRKVSRGVKHATGVYYLYLKVLTILIYFGLPAVALRLAIHRYSSAADPIFGSTRFAWPFVAGAVVALLQMTWLELAGIRRTWRAITS